MVKQAFCPFKEQCGMKSNCNHQGVNHHIPFSCGTARAYEIFKDQ